MLLLNLDFAILRPSVLVAASVFLVKKILKLPVELANLAREFASSEKDIKNVAKSLAIMLSKESESKLTACRRKFKSECYGKVSRIKISVRDIDESRIEVQQTANNGSKSARGINRSPYSPSDGSGVSRGQAGALKSTENSASITPKVNKYSPGVNTTLDNLAASFGTTARSVQKPSSTLQKR